MLHHFYALKMLHIHVNVCDTAQLLAGFFQCNGGKLEEAEDFKCVFVVYLGAQWLSGRVLDSRPRGRRFEPHRHHCVVVLE